jgi:hypothetical protein
MVPLATEFETKHPGTTVWACDFFEAHEYQYHLLFYDAGGVLIGFERWGGYAVLSAALGQDNRERSLGAAISFSRHIGHHSCGASNVRC